MKICSPNLLLNRPSNRDPTENVLDQQAKALFNFNTTIAVMKPPASKKRRLEEDATSARRTVREGRKCLLRCLCPRLSQRRS